MKKKYEDKRVWPEYNQQLIKRGEFYINPKFLETWLVELKGMNAGKIGQPYLYPNSMIEFLAVLHARNFDYRSLEGIISGIAKITLPFPIISYTQICRRLNSLEVSFEATEENLIVAVDGSGEKSSKRGGWMREKWKVRKGWIKVVIMGNTNGEVIDIRVGPETLNEKKAARGMIKGNHKVIKKIIMDGCHDCRETFNLCEQYKIETAIKIRKNANIKSLGSPRRRKEVLLYKKLGYEKWVKEKQYGLRWPSSEGIFSNVTRIFGDSLSSTKKKNMYHEAKIKYWAYNKLKETKV